MCMCVCVCVCVCVSVCLCEDQQTSEIETATVYVLSSGGLSFTPSTQMLYDMRTLFTHVKRTSYNLYIL